MGSQCSKCFDVVLADQPLTERIIKSHDNFAKDQSSQQHQIDHLPSEQSQLDLPRFGQLQSKLMKDTQFHMTFDRRLTETDGLNASLSHKKGPSIIEIDQVPNQFPPLQPSRDLVDGKEYQLEFLFRGKVERNRKKK